VRALGEHEHLGRGLRAGHMYGGHTGTCEGSLPLEAGCRRRTKRGTNEPGCFPAQGGRGEKKKRHKQGQADSTGGRAEAKRTGRAMSSRSTAIVPETGEPRPSNPDL
jgi:hypothetical protein